jgi:hypothetical protein
LEKQVFKLFFLKHKKQQINEKVPQRSINIHMHCHVICLSTSTFIAKDMNILLYLKIFEQYFELDDQKDTSMRISKGKH